MEMSGEGRVEREEEDSVGWAKSRRGEREKKEEAGRKVSTVSEAAQGHLWLCLNELTNC